MICSDPHQDFLAHEAMRDPETGAERFDVDTFSDWLGAECQCRQDVPLVPVIHWAEDRDPRLAEASVAELLTALMGGNEIACLNARDALLARFDRRDA